MLGTLTEKQIVSKITETLDKKALLAALEQCSGESFSMHFTIPGWAITEGRWQDHIPPIRWDSLDEKSGWTLFNPSGWTTQRSLEITCAFHGFSWTCSVQVGRRTYRTNLLEPLERVTSEELSEYFLANAEKIISQPGEAQFLEYHLDPNKTKRATLEGMDKAQVFSVGCLTQCCAQLAVEPFRLYIGPKASSGVFFAYVNCRPESLEGFDMYEWPSCERIHRVKDFAGVVETTGDLWEIAESAGGRDEDVEKIASIRKRRVEERGNKGVVQDIPLIVDTMLVATDSTCQDVEEK